MKRVKNKTNNSYTPRTILTRAYVKSMQEIMSTHNNNFAEPPTNNSIDTPENNHSRTEMNQEESTNSTLETPVPDNVIEPSLEDNTTLDISQTSRTRQSSESSQNSMVAMTQTLNNHSANPHTVSNPANINNPKDSFRPTPQVENNPLSIPSLQVPDRRQFPRKTNERTSVMNSQTGTTLSNGNTANEHVQYSSPSYSSHHRLPHSPNPILNPLTENSSWDSSQIIAQQSQQIQQLLQMMPMLLATRNESPQPSNASILPTFSLPPLDQLMPQFHGKDEDNPLEFLNNFQSTLKTYNIPMDTWKAIMRNQLQHSARSWYDRNSNRFTSFPIFCDLFKHQYNNSTVQTRLKAQFYSNQQMLTENSVNFINAKLKAHKRLFPHQSEDDAIECLIQLLNPQVQVHLLQTPHSIDDLLLKLEIIDKARKIEPERIKSSNKPERSENPKFYATSDGKPTFQKSSTFTNTLQDDKRNYQYPNFVPNCRFCPERHFHKDCPVLKNSKERREMNSPANATNNSPVQPQNPTNNANIQPKTGFSKWNNGPYHKPTNSYPSQPTTNNSPQNKPHVTQVNSPYVSPSICIKIFDKYQPVMLDSGASNCFIEEKALPPNTPLYPCYDIDIMDVSGKVVNVLGQTPLHFTLGKQEYLEDFRVIKEISVPIILGMAWFNKHRAILDFSRNMLIVGNAERENLPFLQRTLEQMRRTPMIPWEEVQHGFPEEHIPAFHSLLSEYADVFDTTVLQQTTATEHHIPLTNNKPVYVHPYRLSPKKQEFVKHQVTDMLTQNLIETSDSPYCSPIVVIEYPNQEKEPRFCIDYRKLNEITVDQNCPSVNIHDLVRNIGDYKIFCTIDLKKGYWQVPLAHDSKPYSAFSTPSGEHYQFKVMPFGLKGAPGTFIRMMGKVLQDLVGNIVEVYLDDLIIKAQTWEDMSRNLRLVLERLRLYQLTASLSKCQFGRTEIKYLGHIITSEHNRAPSAHITAIQQSSPPRTKRQMLSFLGTCNWLREYLPHASEVMAPLYKTTSRKPFKWNESDNKAFNQVKEAFAHLEPLHRPKADLPYVLQTDASKIGLGATLYQQDNDQRRIIANISATLSDTEKNYSSNEKECLAVLWAIRKFRPYVEGQKFILRTDNRALMWLDKFKEERSKLTRWALTLQEYNFSVEHVPGTQNLLPDCLSRNPEPETYADSIASELFPPLPEQEDIPSLRQAHINAFQPESNSLLSTVKTAQKNDDFCNEKVTYYEYLLLIRELDLHKEDKDFLQKYQVINGYLYIRPNGNDDWSIYVPQNCTETVIKHFHTDPLYCHPGITATTTLIRQSYFWPKLHQDVCTFIQLCDPCARTKVAGRIKSHPYKARCVRKKHHTWSVDLMGPYTSSTKGNQYLIVVTDVCSKWIEAKPIRNATTSAIVQFLEDDVFSRFGYPRVIISDNGPQFSSQEWTAACRNWKAKHLTTAIYSPWQNQVERRNQCIKDKLRVQLLDKPHKHWDRAIPKILYALRNSVNQATGKTPAEIYFNQRLRHPEEQNHSDSSSEPSVETPTLFSHHRQAIENQQKYIRRYENKKKAPKLHHADSIIYIRNHELSKANEGFVAALAPKWIGPFRILRVYPSGVYQCVSLNNPNDVRKVSHRDTQFRYHARNPCSEQTYYYNRNNRKHELRAQTPKTTDANKGTEYLRFSCTNSSESRNPESFSPLVDWLSESLQSDRNSLRSSQDFNTTRTRRVRKPNPRYFGDSWYNQY